ncbi:MAG: TetR/AcrR family transcriptional regulator [Kofleriaceae bacterium]
MGKSTSRRGRRPKLQSPELRKEPVERATATFESLIVAAQRVLEQHGVDGLTTNRIAEVAGVSIGSLYQYFPNKEAIVAALTDRYWSAIITAVMPSLGDPTLEPRVVLSRVADALCDAYERLPLIHRHLRDLRAAAGKHGSYDRMVDNFIAAVTAYMHTRKLVAEPDVAAFVIVSTIEGCIMSYTIRRLPFDVRRMATELEHMLVAYVTERASDSA